MSGSRAKKLRRLTEKLFREWGGTPDYSNKFFRRFYRNIKRDYKNGLI